MSATIVRSTVFIGSLAATFLFASSAQAQQVDGDEQAMGPAEPPANAVKTELEQIKSKLGILDDLLDRLPMWFRPYGFLRLDVIYNSAQLNHPQFAQWVLSEDRKLGVWPDDEELTIYARESRIGLTIGPFVLGKDKKKDPDVAWKIEGKFEIDFTGGGSESRALNMMRHAYFTVSKGKFQLLIGQTWDLMGPLDPAVNWDGGQWNAGNLGDRRPQVRVTFTPQVGKKAKLRMAVLAGEPNAVDLKDLDNNGQRDGLDAAIPMMQGVFALEGGLWTKREFILGAGGHYHKEAVSEMSADSPFDTFTTFDSFSVTGFAQVPIVERVFVRGEFFYGQNLSDIRGGIGQGVNISLLRSIRSIGGWGELGVDVVDWLSLYTGGTVDRPFFEDLSDGDRSKNWNVWGAASIRPDPALQFMFEYFYWRTDYKAGLPGTAHRIDVWGAFHF